MWAGKMWRGRLAREKPALSRTAKIFSGVSALIWSSDQKL
jgi:hypothetical protein